MGYDHRKHAWGREAVGGSEGGRGEWWLRGRTVRVGWSWDWEGEGAYEQWGAGAH